MGLEPTTNGITIRYSNQLSYNHRFRAANIKLPGIFFIFFLKIAVHLKVLV